MSQQQSTSRTITIILVAAVAAAIVLVDDRWLRVGFALIPVLLLGHRALGGGTRGSHAEDSARGGEERRTNTKLREQVQALLTLIREFYTTCHMVAVGQLEPSKAKGKARDVERRLNAMMAEMLEQIEEAPAAE